MTRLFQRKKRKSKKNALPQEFIDQVHAMKPEDLAVETTREQMAVETLKEQMKEDQTIQDAAKVVKDMEEEFDNDDEVRKAKDALAEILEAKKNSEEYLQAKLDLKLHKETWTKDIRDRNKKIKFMMKTLRSHMNSGALKFKKP